MAFPELLQHVGNFGRFQITLSILTIVLITFMSTHNLLEVFSAAIPAHCCYIHLLVSTTSETKDTMNLIVEALLRISIPMDPNQRYEQCCQFRQTQWQLLDPNELATNTTELETESCLDGWTYDQNIFTSIIVTQIWPENCVAGFFPVLGTPGHLFRFCPNLPSLLYNKIPYVNITGDNIQQFYCTSMGSYQCQAHDHYNGLSVSEQWPNITRRTGLCVLSLAHATSVLHFCVLLCLLSVPVVVVRVYSLAYCIWQAGKSIKRNEKSSSFKWKKKFAESLYIEVLQSVMKEELAFLKNNSKEMKTIANPTIYKIIFLLCTLRFSGIFFIYGVMFDLQLLGSDVFLSRALLGAVDLPSKFLSFIVMRFLKRRHSIAFVLFLAGVFTFINIFIPQDMLPFVHLGIAMVGKGSMAMYFSMSITYNHESTPTGSAVQGILSLISGLATALGSLVSITRQYFEPLPLNLYGTFPIVASICVYFLPETLNLPLSDTTEDVEKRDKNYRKKCTKEEQINNLLGTTEC